MFEECYRVLKDGAFAFVMSIPRSDLQSRMSTILENAGFNIGFTPIYWTYASGFTKATDIPKAIDKKLGAKRKVIGTKITGNATQALQNSKESANGNIKNQGNQIVNITEDATPESKKFSGAKAGFQPKPAVEVVIVAMKPLSEKTYVDQCLANGKGITWLENCRIPIGKGDTKKRMTRYCLPHHESIQHPEKFQYWNSMIKLRPSYEGYDTGRFPANLLISDGVLDDGRLHTGGSYSKFFDLDCWFTNYPFAITPKPSPSEKNHGMNGETPHPTTKPVKLMAYLIVLGSRPGDVVLDPFAGSGTTGIAAQYLERKYILIEKDENYSKILSKRMEAWNRSLPQTKLFGS